MKQDCAVQFGDLCWSGHPLAALLLWPLWGFAAAIAVKRMAKRVGDWEYQHPFPSSIMICGPLFLLMLFWLRPGSRGAWGPKLRFWERRDHD